MIVLLAGTGIGIGMIGKYQGLVTRVEFKCSHGHTPSMHRPAALPTGRPAPGARVVPSAIDRTPASPVELVLQAKPTMVQRRRSPGRRGRTRGHWAWAEQRQLP